VLTAHYLVMGASEVRLAGMDGRDREVQRVSLDHETGLALLAVSGDPLTPVRIGSSTEILPGLPVFMLTWTGERERKGAVGHVSVVGPFEAFWEYMLDRAIMTTAINPGLAGAPLFDPDARLIGIVSLGLAAVGRYSLAIPVELYLAHRPVLESGDGPQPRRAWVGFFPQAFDGGVLISGVVNGGPAEKAGLAKGDLLLSVEGRPVYSLRELYREIWKKQPGETISVQILRDSAIRIVEIAAADRYEFFK
jgi:S1-C subfamily serine protease